MRSTDRPLTLALLGCGNIAARHARTIRAVDARVRIGFASRDPGRAAEFARRLGGVAHWPTYEAAMADRAVDAVLIATPPATHRPLTLAALAAGRDVIVEKPAFLCASDVDVASAAAAASGRQVLVAENYAYKPLAGLLRAVVTSGDLGDVRFVAVNALKRLVRDDWRDDAALAGGGALFEGGVHWMDLMAHLGLTVESVQGFRPGPLDTIERSLLVVVQYEEGAVGTLQHSWETGGALRGLQLSRIAGTAGSLSFESNGVLAHLHARRSRWFAPGLRDIEGYRAMFADFFAALRGVTEPRMTLARARLDLALVESAQGGTP